MEENALSAQSFEVPLQEHCYDVALWVTWPSLFPDHVEEVYAPDMFSALHLVMNMFNRRVIARAAVGRKYGEKLDRFQLRCSHLLTTDEGELWIGRVLVW